MLHLLERLAVRIGAAHRFNSGSGRHFAAVWIGLLWVSTDT